MAQRDVLPNITDPTLIPTGQPAPAAAVVEESKGLFTTVVENKLIVIIVIMVIIAIGFFAYFIAYKGTDKEEVTPQKGTGVHNFAGQNMNLATQAPYLQHQFMQPVQPVQPMQQPNMQQPVQFQQPVQSMQSTPQQTQQQPKTQPLNQTAVVAAVPRPASNTGSSAIDLLNRSKNSIMNMHDNVKTVAMQNVLTAPNVANQRAKIEPNMNDQRESDKMPNLQDDDSHEFSGLHNEQGDYFEQSEQSEQQREQSEQREQNLDDQFNNQDEKMMNNKLELNQLQYPEQDDPDLDKRFDKAFDLQQENLIGNSQNPAKTGQMIAHCEYMVKNRYCKLPAQYGNKCHMHHDK